jgi:hypothetical protein
MRSWQFSRLKIIWNIINLIIMKKPIFWIIAILMIFSSCKQSRNPMEIVVETKTTNIDYEKVRSNYQQRWLRIIQDTVFGKMLWSQNENILEEIALSAKNLGLMVQQGQTITALQTAMDRWEGNADLAKAIKDENWDETLRLATERSKYLDRVLEKNPEVVMRSDVQSHVKILGLRVPVIRSRKIETTILHPGEMMFNIDSLSSVRFGPMSGPWISEEQTKYNGSIGGPGKTIIRVPGSPVACVQDLSESRILTIPIEIMGTWISPMYFKTNNGEFTLYPSMIVRMYLTPSQINNLKIFGMNKGKRIPINVRTAFPQLIKQVKNYEHIGLGMEPSQKRRVQAVAARNANYNKRVKFYEVLAILAIEDHMEYHLLTQ